MDIENIQITIKSNSRAAVVGIDDMVSALKRLRESSNGGSRGLTTTANQLKKFSDAVGKLSIDTSKFAALSDAMKSLSGIEKASGFSSTINTLKKLPEVIDNLDKANLDKFASQMERVATAIRPLATEMQKVSDGFRAFPIRIQKLIESNAGLAASNVKTGKSFRSLLGNILNFATIRYVGRILQNLVKRSSEYTETLNLFTVAMGQYADEAFEYAEKVSEIMGIDPAEWMRAQGVFMTLATGFGIAGDRAAYMSKNLTQLGYDISSYYNISVEDAMQKLQSGISGELEPLRRLGYDLSQAKLEALALSYGIDKSVSSMTQAEKGVLRYQAIMTQVTQVQGDMARTLDSPANQMRILTAAANQAARALGNIFIPALNSILPAAIAFLNVIRTVANAIANLFGFQLKKVDYSGGLGTAADAAGDIEKSLGGGAGSAKKMRDYLMGIDELNVLPDQSSGGGGGGGGGSLADVSNMELTGYDFLGDALSTKINEIQERMEKWLPVIKAVGIAIAAAFAVIGIVKFIKRLSDLAKIIGSGGLLGRMSKLNAVVIGLVASFSSATAITYGFAIKGKTLEGVLLGLAVGIGVVGTALHFLIGPIGWVVAAIGAAIGVMTGLHLSAKQLGEDAYKASSEYAAMAEVIANSEEVIERSRQAMEGLGANAERLNSIDVEWTSIQSLVDRIFELNDKTNLTKRELAELQAKVQVLNGMGLEGLQLTFDETTGRVLETRDAIQGVIDKLYEQAKVTAYTEMLTEAYKAQNQAAQDYYSTLTAQESATQELESAQSALNDKFGSQMWLYNAGAGFILEWNKEYQEMRSRVEGAESALSAANQAHEDATSALKAETDAIGEYEGALADIMSGEGFDTTGFSAIVSNALSDIDYDSTARNIVDGISGGIEAQGGPLDETMASLATGMHGAFNAALQIKSPSKLFEESGMYAIQGAANGVTANAHLLNAAIENAGTESAAAFGNNYARQLMRGVEAGLASTTDSAANTFRRYVSNLVGEIGKIKTEFTNVSNAAKTMATNVNSSIASIKGKDVSVNIRHNASEAVSEINRQLEKIGKGLSVAIKITVMSDGGIVKNFANGGIIPAAALGGNFNTGQLFIAREAGPELVSGIGGGRTAVMNNNQIVESVSNGVYRAVVDAMAAQPTDNGDVVLVLGDKEVYRASKRGEKASGYTLVSNPSFA